MTRWEKFQTHNWSRDDKSLISTCVDCDNWFKSYHKVDDEEYFLRLFKNDKVILSCGDVMIEQILK